MVPSGLLNLVGQVFSTVIEDPTTYFLPAFFIITLILVSAYRLKEKKLNIPFFGNGDGNPDAARKRWMSDSINLLSEGYTKVSHHSPSAVLDFLKMG